MQKETVIQSIKVGQNLQLTYSVGEEVHGQVVIEIKQVGTQYDDSIHSELWLLNEDGELILSIENMPVIIEWKSVVIDDK